MNPAEPPADTAAAPAPRGPWQPLTFRGLARFAQAAAGRLFLVELVTAILVALSVIWFLEKAYAPVIAEAARKMPDGAKIQGGKLSGVPETLLSETRLLAIALTPDESTEIGQSADAQIQFRNTNFRIGSSFEPDWGLQWDYTDWNVDMSRTALEPLWGAWKPVVMVICGVSVVIMLGLSWAFFAFIYLIPVKCAAWFADRRLTWLGAWKLASASMIPGAFLLILALFLYGIEAVDLIGLASFYAGHFVLGWIYLAAGVFFLERSAPAPAPNPFVTSK